MKLIVRGPLPPRKGDIDRVIDRLNVVETVGINFVGPAAVLAHPSYYISETRTPNHLVQPPTFSYFDGFGRSIVDESEKH